MYIIFINWYPFRMYVVVYYTHIMSPSDLSHFLTLHLQLPFWLFTLDSHFSFLTLWDYPVMCGLYLKNQDQDTECSELISADLFLLQQLTAQQNMQKR